MIGSEDEQIEQAVSLLRLYGKTVSINFIGSLLIWLFGNLVFIPLGESLNVQTKIIVSLIFLIAFTIPIIRTLSPLKKLINAFSVLPSKKLIRRGFTLENSQLILQYSMFIITGVIFYLLFSPFLFIIHPSINGIILILLLIWIFVLLLKMTSILLPKFFKWLIK